MPRATVRGETLCHNLENAAAMCNAVCLWCAESGRRTITVQSSSWEPVERRGVTAHQRVVRSTRFFRSRILTIIVRAPPRIMKETTGWKTAG